MKNLQLEGGVIHRGARLTSLQYDNILSKFGQQQLVMVNYACGFNQSETQNILNE